MRRPALLRMPGICAMSCWARTAVESNRKAASHQRRSGIVLERGALAAGTQDAENFLQPLAHAAQFVAAALYGKGQAGLLARPGDGEALVVQKFLDAQRVFHFAPPVHALPGAALAGLELRKFSFPE